MEPGGQYELIQGAEFSLKCIALVYPVTALAWVKLRNRQPGNSNRLLIVIYFYTKSEIDFPALASSTSGSVNLTLTNVTADDAGEYACVASSPYTFVNITANIYILCKSCNHCKDLF